MTRRSTFSEMRWPMDAASLAQAQGWAESVSIQVLDWTWRAFDNLRATHLSQVDLDQPLEQLERDLTSKHFILINQIWAQETQGYSSVSPVHEFPENETRPAAPGKPPAYDLAFVWQENQRVTWPIEAKVLKTPAAVAEYMRDVKKFVSGTAAPLVGQGGLIAYLLTGQAAEFFAQLQLYLIAKLEPASAFSPRPHRTSRHHRKTAPILHLHHLVMLCEREPGDH